MQQPITRREVYEPSLTAAIGGRELELVSAAVDRMLPDPVVGGTLTSASGELVAVEGDDVVSTVATPWDPGTQWPPVPETPATVRMDTGSGPVSLLTNGRVISAGGGTSGREVSVEVADQYQSLDKTISWDAVAATMPSLEWDWDRMRYVNMHGVSIADMILRHCGWYSTPPALPWAGLSIPGQGTMWPERGECTNAGRRSVGTRGYAAWVNAPWGLGVTDFEGEYRLGGRMVLSERGHLEMTALTTAPDDYSRIELRNESNNGLARLQWTASTVYVQVRGASGSFVNAASVPRSDGLAYATVSYVSNTSAYCTVRSGGVSSGASVAIDPLVATTVARNVTVISTGATAGIQVALPSTAGGLEGWVPNARIYPRAARRNHLEVRRSEEGVNCADFLAKLCEAECATYWIDETGVLQWWDLARLESKSSAATLTADDDIAEQGFTWSHSMSSVRSRTAVKWAQPLRTWSSSQSTDLWQGSGQTLQPGDVVEDWINVPDDEVWIMTDTSISRAPGSGSLTEFNYGWGSWYGARGDRGDGIDTWAQLMGSGSLLMTVERVTDRAFKTWLQWTGDLPVMQKTISAASGSSVWMARRDMDLPIIRGKAKFKFTDRLTYSAQSGPGSAPEHGVDADWLIQDAAQAQYTADYYGARVTIPQPVLSSVALIPVPGLQLGDMVEVRDEVITRLTIRGLVVADSKSITAGMDLSHAVAVRPLYVTRNGVTWREWASVVQGDTWADWASDKGTWRQWGDAPLLGEEVI